MYWEEVWDMYELASNSEIIEKNESMKFNFIIHAQSKEAMESWEDLPLPFPDQKWQIQMQKNAQKNRDASGLPSKFKSEMLKRRGISRKEATQEDKDRFAEVKRRVRETQEKAVRLKEEKMFNQYFKK